MNFYLPTKVYSEKDCVRNHAAEMAIGKRALIVTGKHSSRRNHSLDDVTAALEGNNISYTIFDDVEENPSVETVMAARDSGLDFNADFVIGIGGGSPLDCAKAAALMMKNSDKPWEFLYQTGAAEHLPVISVPTSCGTGSEVTGVSVITRHDLRTKASVKHKIFPVLALIDGKYIMETPKSIIANTSVDALSHLIESGVNTLSDTFSDMIVYAGLKEWKKCRPYIEGKPLDEEGAQILMNASALAGMAIAQNGTTLPHSLSYPLTYEKHIPHGAAVGAFQANYLSFAPDHMQNAVLSACGFESIDDMRQFIKKYCPVKADKELLKRSAETVLNLPAKLALCPFKVDRDVMERIVDI